MTPKIDKKLNDYVEKNYKEIKDDIIVKDTKYIEKDSTYRKKVVNKKNKNLYFYVNYKNKKIKSSYKKDYQEGATLFNKEKIEFEKEISNKYKETKITFHKKLNSYKKINKRLKKRRRNPSLYTRNMLYQAECPVFHRKH